MAEIGELMAFVKVREAIGDPDGKLMQDEVIDRVRHMVRENAELKRMRTDLQARNTELVLENRKNRAKLQRAAEQIRQQNRNCLCCKCDGRGLI